VRRIGRVISEQVELFASITGEHETLPTPSSASRPGAGGSDQARGSGDVVPFPPREDA
jgi:hypothetical protein